MQRGRLFKRIGKSHGFSLAEVMVAAGMLGIVSLGLMKMTEQSTKNQKKMRIDFNVNSLLYELSVINKSADACEATLGGHTITGLPGTPVTLVNGIRNASGNAIISAGDVVGTGSGGAVTIDAISLVDVDPAVSTAGATPVTYTLTIQIDMTKNGVENGANLSKRFNVTFVDNDENGIISFPTDSCVSEAIAKGAVCEALGGVVVNVGANERCANIDLFNNATDAGGTGISQYYGVTARGGLMVTNDPVAPADWGNAPTNFWSIVPDINAPSTLSIGIDADNNPTAGRYSVLELSANTDGTSRAIKTNADTHTFASAGGTSRLVLDNAGDVSYFPNGNVGVGTTSPSYKLDVKDGAIRVYNSAGTDADLRFANNVSTAGKITYSSQEMQFFTAGSQRAVIDASGNVGIGTTEPEHRLTVNGPVSVPYNANSNNFLIYPNDGRGNIHMYWNSTGTVSPKAKETGAGFDLTLNTGNTLNLQTAASVTAGNTQTFVNTTTWTGDGNVGIGTTNPQGRLHVWGSGYLTQSIAQIGTTVGSGTVDCTSATDTDCKIVNKAWVYNLLSAEIASSLTPAQRDAIVAEILRTTDTTWSTVLKPDVLDDITVTYDSTSSQTYTSQECTTGYVKGITYNGTGGIYFKCSTATSGGQCDVKEGCANVYSGSGAAGKLCVRDASGTFTCISSGQKTYLSNCSFVSSTYDRIVTGDHFASCGGNKFIKSVNFITNSTTNVRASNNAYKIECCDATIFGAE